MSAKEPTPEERREFKRSEAAAVRSLVCGAEIAEARHATLERVREGVERLPTVKHRNLFPGHWIVNLDAVLALLDELDR